jgi:hypothetical protein
VLARAFIAAARVAGLCGILGAFACRTREDAALSLARETARAAARVCADASDGEVCRDPICRSGCGVYADAPHLIEACIARCMGRDTCNSDRDCDRGLVCRMIAPVVRRCQPPLEVEP